VIVGSGPAGLSAGINAARSGLRTLILETEEFGGKTAGSSLYENYPGFPEGIMGSELVERMLKQALRFGAEVRHLEEVVGLDLKKYLKEITTSKTRYAALTVIVTTGTQRRKLDVSGESMLVGRGVSYCRACDGPLFRNLNVAVVGFTEGAVKDALFLSKIAKEVYLITQGERINVPNDLMKRLQEKTNVRIIKGRVVTILGEQVVKALKMKVEDKEELLEQIQGVFVSLGKVPLTGIVEKAGVQVDEGGCIKVDRWQRTNIEGVFAAGDCTCGGMQVVTAVGEGAMASIQALRRVRQMKGNDL
jgi:thioredoxin reductase (NADPH)